MLPNTSSRNQPEKTGKVRRVLKSAAQFHGTSLNESLLSCPDLLQNLIHVLITFRQPQYAVSADIKGILFHVCVLDCDHLSLRFLWREDHPTNTVM